MEIYKSKVYIANRYWNSKSYGIFSTEMLVIFPLLWLLKQSTIDFLKVPDVGNCWQTHSTNEFVSKAKSSMFLSRSSGNAILFVLVTTIEACKYSSFDFSSSPITPSAVYTLTCILDYYFFFNSFIFCGKRIMRRVTLLQLINFLKHTDFADVLLEASYMYHLQCT